MIGTTAVVEIATAIRFFAAFASWIASPPAAVSVAISMKPMPAPK
jgi:hypothetical protein